jgi:hypothetical protein
LVSGWSFLDVNVAASLEASEPFRTKKVYSSICRLSNNLMAGNEGFEPPITGPEPVALPLGQFPKLGGKHRQQMDFTLKSGNFQRPDDTALPGGP